MKSLLYLLICLSAVLHAEIIWQADFGQTGELDWKKVRENPVDSFRTGNGILEAVCSNLGKKPNTGALYEKKLPDIECGALFFDVLPNATKTGPGNYDNLSLLIRFHGRLVSIRPGWWTFFHPKSGHRRLAELPAGEWLRFKIGFDRKAKTISYYCNDMNIPVYVENGVEFSGPVRLQFGNYGLTRGTVVNRIRNVRLETLRKDEKTRRSGVVILRGINFDSYDLDGIVEAFGIPGKTVCFDVQIDTGLLIKNNFSLSRRPLFSTLKPALIIMADFPLNGTLEPSEVRALVSEVKAGANLIILGGMFTLNRGEFRIRELNDILPVKVGSPFDIRYKKENFAVEGAPGAVAIYQKCVPADGAEIFLKAEGNPLLGVIRKGQGKACVYTGIPGGRPGNKGEMLHKQKRFPAILKQAFGKEK